MGELLALAFDLRVALHLLVLLLHVVLGHHHFFVELLSRDEEIDDADHDEHRGGLQHVVPEQPRSIVHRVFERLRDDEHHVVQRIGHHVPSHDAHHEELHDVLDELDDLLDLEHVLQPVDRVELVELRDDRFEGQEEARLNDVREHAHDEHDAADRQRDLEQERDRVLHQLACGGEVGAAKRGVDRGDGEVFDLAADEAHQRRQGHEPAGEAHGADEVLRLRDLAFLARLPELLRCRFFGFFAGVAQGAKAG